MAMREDLLTEWTLKTHFTEAVRNLMAISEECEYIGKNLLRSCWFYVMDVTSPRYDPDTWHIES